LLYEDKRMKEPTPCGIFKDENMAEMDFSKFTYEIKSN
jgi:hypothetical protein